MEMIDEVKFSPNGRMLAAGSHDNYIDIYSTANYEVSRALGLDSKPEHVTDVGLRSAAPPRVSLCGG